MGSLRSPLKVQVFLSGSAVNVKSSLQNLVKLTAVASHSTPLIMKACSNGFQFSETVSAPPRKKESAGDWLSRTPLGIH